MKKTILLFSTIFISTLILAQTDSYLITGTIIDAVTKNPMQGASVFAENTTIGTASGSNGNFQLRLPNGGYDLVITFTGYETTTKRITTADAENKELVIEVKHKEKELEDVVIKSSSEVADGWEKYGTFFLDNFIGKTNNSKLCTITNKEVLKFYYYKRRNRLKVLATAPVEMENLALGYRIKYTLDSFVHEYNTEASVYTGSSLFEEIPAKDTTEMTTWKTNRQKAYNGSILHFMRSVYNKSLKEEGFEIQFVAKNNDVETAIKVSNFYTAINYNKDDSTQLVDIMPNQPNVAVIYNKEEPDPGYLAQNDEKAKKFQVSIISIVPNESLGIEQNGYYFDQNDITITGYWIWDKVADLLPYDYVPN
ncbi:MAG: carboxypeptidase-like regulatory domain-containing protein [Ferruginibacter sp.]